MSGGVQRCSRELDQSARAVVQTLHRLLVPAVVVHTVPSRAEVSLAFVPNLVPLSSQLHGRVVERLVSPVVEYAGLEVGRGLSQRRPTVAAVLALSEVVWELEAVPFELQSGRVRREGRDRTAQALVKARPLPERHRRPFGAACRENSAGVEA